MYKLIEDLKEADMEDLIPDEREIEDELSEYKDYSNEPYDQNKISLDEFCIIFGIDRYDEERSLEEQLDTPLNEIMGITRPQLRFIDDDLIFNKDVIGGFISAMNSDKLKNYSVEQRIIIASIIAYMQEDSSSSDFDFYLSAAKHRQIQNAIAIIKEYEDCKSMYTSIEKTMMENNFAEVVKEEDREMLYKKFKEFDVWHLKPSHVHDIHGKLVRFKREFDSIYEAETTEFKNNMMKETAKSPLYKKFLYKGRIYQVCGINTYTELKREGKELSHCVAEYANDIIESKCFIYSIRCNDNPSTPVYTVEVKRGRTVLEGGQFRLTQCYGYDDTTDKPEELRDFINEWCAKKGIRIECEV